MDAQASQLLICTACGTQSDEESRSVLTRCRICDDPRQFVPPGVSRVGGQGLAEPARPVRPGEDVRPGNGRGDPSPGREDRRRDPENKRSFPRITLGKETGAKARTGGRGRRPQGMNSYAFMWSIPTMIPLTPDEVLGVWNVWKKHEFRATHGACVGTEVKDGSYGADTTVQQRGSWREPCEQAVWFTGLLAGDQGLVGLFNVAIQATAWAILATKSSELATTVAQAPAACSSKLYTYQRTTVVVNAPGESHEPLPRQLPSRKRPPRTATSSVPCFWCSSYYL
ncbi:unnamed protein product [Diplocarpon coronariae]